MLGYIQLFTIIFIYKLTLSCYLQVTILKHLFFIFRKPSILVRSVISTSKITKFETVIFSIRFNKIDWTCKVFCYIKTYQNYHHLNYIQLQSRYRASPVLKSVFEPWSEYQTLGPLFRHLNIWILNSMVEYCLKSGPKLQT